ncbi:hypothetical protein [Promicromonospora sp. NPDC059942]|uniref:hypothetical protein n=1 Tax=Promicromonospora sp. NPDC059942 TaxID=3347009 RepID=UPI00366136D9
MAEQWDIAPGTVTTRAAVAGRFGGAVYGGIEPSGKTPNVMVYSDPARGIRHGYNFDGWADDGAFYYTGEGQNGDQVETSRGNRAILRHVQQGRALRVFEAMPGPQSTKPQKYIGEFTIDSADPVRREDALGTDGVPRTVLVFKLLRVSAVAPAGDEHLADKPEHSPGDVFVPSENNRVRKFDVTASMGTTAVRREAELMAELEKVLRAKGNAVGRRKLTVPGSSVPLWTDTFDDSTKVLYEVKASSERRAVREAIGQLLDYRRFVSELAACTVVLPTRPAEDLIDLVHDVGFELVAKVEGVLVRITADHQSDVLR